MRRRGGRSIPHMVASVYVLIPLVVVAATALAYYSYRYADEMARRGEQSIVDTTADLGELLIANIEDLLVKSDQTVFNVVDLSSLKDLRARWKDAGPLAPSVESVIVLDEGGAIAPDGFVSKKGSAQEAEQFRTLFEREMVKDLHIYRLNDGEHRYLHRELDGRYYLLSVTRRDFRGRRWYIVLEASMTHLVLEVLPRAFEFVKQRRYFQVVDEHEAVVFGYVFTQIPHKYQVTLTFPTTLTRWKLRLAPLEAPSLVAQESARRVVDFVLIGLSALTLFVGLGILTLAMRTEQRANALKSDFIANVSHELKTPLSLIRMFGELLATGRTKGAESSKEYAEIITRESERLSRLIDNVLDFARIERGKVAYDFKVGDLADVLSRGLDVYRYRLDREGMKLHVEIDSDLPPVRIDENAMMLVLLNLVDNAVKYAAEGKELTVSLRRRGDRVLLAVADKGPGVNVDERERIFERFYRSKTVRGQSVRGSGIGLSLVKHIAEAHGGGADVESEVGKGSTFTVWIPVAADEHLDANPTDEAVA